MPIETRHEFHNEYIHYYCSGPFELPAMMEVFSDVFRLASERKLGLILVDGMEIIGVPPKTMDRFRLGEYAAELCRNYGRPVRIAIAGEEPFVDPERFGETVARNRGANGKVFTDLEEAKEWLNL